MDLFLLYPSMPSRREVAVGWLAVSAESSRATYRMSIGCTGSPHVETDPHGGVDPAPETVSPFLNFGRRSPPSFLQSALTQEHGDKRDVCHRRTPTRRSIWSW